MLQLYVRLCRQTMTDCLALQQNNKFGSARINNIYCKINMHQPTVIYCHMRNLINQMIHRVPHRHMIELTFVNYLCHNRDMRSSKLRT